MDNIPVVIMTGAGSGIGQAACELLAPDHRIVLVGRDERKLLATVDRIGKHVRAGKETLVVPADISDRGQAESVIDIALEKWGRIDALVNNAAILHVQPIGQVDEATMYKTFAINTFGPAYLIAKTWSTFVNRRGGRVVNISSMAAIDPFPGLAMYAASKAALESYTRSIMNEGRDHGILAFSIAFGSVETTMLRQIASPAQLPRERTLDPRDAAAVIAACVRGERDADAGQQIIVRKQ